MPKGDGSRVGVLPKDLTAASLLLKTVYDTNIRLDA